MTLTGTYTGTMNIKKIGNSKTNPDYELRLNQDDCTTIELKQADNEEETFPWLMGGTLSPYGAPFTGYDAYTFNRSVVE